MRKSRDTAWRHCYFYICKGVCGRKRATFDHERYLMAVCTRCEPQKVDPNQTSIFGGGEPHHS